MNLPVGLNMRESASLNFSKFNKMSHISSRNANENGKLSKLNDTIDSIVKISESNNEQKITLITPAAFSNSSIRELTLNFARTNEP